MPIQPYPGLRPFQPEEHNLFFGQEDNLAKLFQRLAKKHFIAVLGESGCGKSSLVRAGLIPMLVPTHAGAVVSWRVIITQPGMEPIHKLAHDLKGLNNNLEKTVPDIEDTLRANPMGLIRVVEQTRDSSKKFLLIIVDQFEELFRFRREAQESHRDDQAALYVKLLLNAAQDEIADVYVVITMRSEYLGEASQFYNLAEAISDGLFLLPRMKRVQCEDAIVQPALFVGTALQQSIVQRFLNETEEREDGLPLLQHGLRRLWDTAINRSEPPNITLPKEFDEKLGVDYVKWSLDDHLNEIFKELDPAQQQIAAKLFKLLGERDLKGRLTRRPTEWREIKAISPDQESILKVIDAFRDEQRGRTFLVPSQQQRETFADGEKLDISHEVLLRRWTTYSKWLAEESKDSDRYYWLADAADRWAKRDGGLLQGVELSSLITWKKDFQPSAAWASRYTGGWDETLKRNRREYAPAMEFLDESLKVFNLRAEEQRAREEVEKARVLEAEAAARDRLAEAERKRWKNRVTIVVSCVVIGLIVIEVWFHKADANKASKAEASIAIAAAEGPTIDQRGSAALTAALLTQETEDEKLKTEFPQLIRLDHWELFSAARKGTPINPEHGFLGSSCGIALDSAHQYVGLADRQSLQIWHMGERWNRVASAPLPGIDCLRFSSDGKQLAASVYPNLDPNAMTIDPNITGAIERLSFDHGSLRRLPQFDINNVNALISFSFVGNSKQLAILTQRGLAIDTAPLSPAFGTSGPLVRAGVFSPDHRSLSISFEDGENRVVTLEVGKPHLQDARELLKRGQRLIFDPPNELPKLFPKLSKRAKLQRDKLQSVAFSRDSSQIVTGSSKGWITLQDNPCQPPARKTPPVVLGQMAGSINALAITSSSANEPLIAVGTDTAAVAVFQFQPSATSAASMDSPRNDPRLIHSNDDYTPRVFSLQGAVTWVDFDNDGNHLITASTDQKARVFEIGSGVEVERIPHNALVVFAVAAGGGILSASQDSDLRETDALKPIVAREWPPGACPPEASALSTIGNWAWSCEGSIHSSDGVLQTAESAESTEVQSMYFNKDGSALIWLDKHYTNAPKQFAKNYSFGIHYAARSPQRWMDHPAAGFLPQTADSPVMAISPDGSLIAVAFGPDVGTREGEWEIETFSVTGNPVSGLVSRSFSVGKTRILSLALNSEGDIAAGTVKNSVLYFPRHGDPKPERYLGTRGESTGDHSTVNEAEGTGSGPEAESLGQIVFTAWHWIELRIHSAAQQLTSGAAFQSNDLNQVVTAVAFVGDDKLLAATNDRTIWLFKDAKTGQATRQGRLAEPCDRFVFNSPRNEAAAVAGPTATFFTFGDKGLTTEFTLQEPGEIQSLVFGEGRTAITSVATSDSLTKIGHSLQIGDHERRICDEQPTWSMNGSTLSDCQQLLKQKPP